MSRTDHPRPSRTRPRTEVLYARLPADLVEWIRGQAGRSGLSMAAAAATMLAYCRDSGLTLHAATPTPPALMVARDVSRLDLPR